MFRFFSSSRAAVFEERRKKQEVWRVMRRIIDTSTSESLLPDEDNRQEPRYPLSMPVLIQGFDAEAKSSPGIAISKNISDDGVSLMCPFEVTSELAFCCIWEEQPMCFIGSVRQSRYAGGGYWEIGIEFQEITSLGEWGSLRSLAMSLNPYTK